MISIPCPEYGLPAQVLSRLDLRSTDGPIEHREVRRHRSVVGHFLTPRPQGLRELPQPRSAAERMLLGATHQSLGFGSWRARYPLTP
jgi:hypothetical protein